jgi:sugar (pentulose or hexulose) kinase
LGRPLELARQPEVGARGAAMAALAATGREFDIEAWTRPDAVVLPRKANVALYEEGFRVYRGRLEAARGHWRGPVFVPER